MDIARTIAVAVAAAAAAAAAVAAAAVVVVVHHCLQTHCLLPRTILDSLPLLHLPELLLLLLLLLLLVRPYSSPWRARPLMFRLDPATAVGTLRKAGPEEQKANKIYNFCSFIYCRIEWTETLTARSDANGFAVGSEFSLHPAFLYLALIYLRRKKKKR